MPEGKVIVLSIEDTSKPVGVLTVATVEIFCHSSEIINQQPNNNKKTSSFFHSFHHPTISPKKNILTIFSVTAFLFVIYPLLYSSYSSAFPLPLPSSPCFFLT
ncbi:unnamed protein product [Absidia cylindrospora]